MKRRKLALVLVLILTLLVNTLTSFAHPTAREHDSELIAVLLENGYSKYRSNDIKKSIEALECASYLTIDQFGGKGEEQYKKLKKMRIRGLPWKFSSIDYNTVVGNEEKKITANTHRMYTHQGWDRDYTSKSKDAEKFWNNRRKILLGTVNTIFDLNNGITIRYSDKCNSLAGIIYYVHILGDYNEADKYTKISLLPDLAGRDNANDKDKDYDIVTALKKYIEILFVDQKNTTDYKELMEGLENVGDEAGKIKNSVGGVNNDEEFTEYHECADEVLALLTKHIPILLKNEEFFVKVFYPEKQK